MSQPKNTTASPIVRLIAFMLDFLIILAIILVLSAPLTIITQTRDITPNILLIVSQIVLVSILYTFLCVYLTSAIGQTPGKLLSGIRVVKEDGPLLTFKGALYRELIAKMLSNGFFFLGYFWAFHDKKSQTWHDQAANTYVVYAHNKGALSGVASLILLLIIGGYFCYQIVGNIQSSQSVVNEIVETVKTKMQERDEVQPENRYNK